MVLDRIKQYIDFKGITVAAFERSIGMSNASFGKSLKTGGNIGSDKLENILSLYSDLSPNWLLTGRGDMIILGDTSAFNCDRGDDFGVGSDDKNCKVDCQADCKVDDKSVDIHRNCSGGITIEMQQIPLYELEATAGIASVFDKAVNPINYIAIPNLPKCDGAIHVRGNSMAPLLQSGDLVVFKMSSSLQYILWGDIYIVSFSLEGDEYTVVKMLQKSDKADHIKLVSYNPENEPMDIPMSTIRQLAHVKAWIHYNSMG